MIKISNEKFIVLYNIISSILQLNIRKEQQQEELVNKVELIYQQNAKLFCKCRWLI